MLGTRKEYLSMSLRNNPLAVMDDETAKEAIEEVTHPRVVVPPSRFEQLRKSDEEQDPMKKLQDTYSVRVNRVKPKPKVEEQKQERALLNYDKKQREWEKVTQRVAKKSGRDPSQLIMEKSGPEYRAKLEEMAILDAAIPPTQKITHVNWETSLRASM